LAVDQIGKFTPPLLPEATKAPQQKQPQGASFSDTISKFINDVDQLQRDAGEAIDKLASGESTDLHQVMIAVEKADVSFDLLMEIRNKMLEAYHEIMRMQV